MTRTAVTESNFALRIQLLECQMSLVERLIRSVHQQGLLEEAYSVNNAMKQIPGGAVAVHPWESFEGSQEQLTLVLSAAVASDDFRKKVFQPSYPVEIGKIGYMSDQDLGYAIRGGFNCATLVADYMNKYCSLPQNAEILDFGSGTLRVCRYLIQFMGNFKYSACDVNSFSIKWAEKEFEERANVFLMGNKPPLTLGSESMNFVFAWSIFSHYSENIHQAWLKELHRILRPGGFLFLTFQSEVLLSRMESEANMIPQVRAEGVDLQELRRDYLSRGFCFYDCYPKSEDDFGFDLDNFGMAFISPAYIRREWTNLFEVVCIDPGVVANFQDIVLLRKLPANMSSSTDS